MILATLSNGGYVFFTILIAILILALTILLFWQYRMAHRDFKEERAIMMDGLMSKSDFHSSINSYLTKVTKDTVFALFYIDLDKFMDVVNAFGQKISNRVLESIAQKIAKKLPKRTQMARYNKDEFIIFLPGDYSRYEYLEVAETIRSVINEPITVMHNTNIQITGSIGISYYPLHGETLKQLLKSLKIAIYIAKREGGNRFVTYSDEMNEREAENVQYYYEIKEAISRKEFVLYYQPIINHNKKTFYSAEALLRWNHPEHGVLAPSHFINILEKSGDIIWVGLWCFEQTILTHQEIQKKFPTLNFKLSFNLSPKQLMNESLAVDFQRLLKKYHFQASNIILEIAEYALFERYEVIGQNIKQLKELGFLLAIDGLGLDYSSLTKLEYSPINIIKLDRVFLTLDNDSYMKRKFATLLIDFAKNNDRIIISEGVETQEMVENVKGFGIDLIQGYFYSKPISKDDLLEYIKNEQWKSGLPNNQPKEVLENQKVIINLESNDDVE